MFKSKYFTCSCCNKSLQENRTNFVWFKHADENGKWHRDTCRECEKEQLIKDNIKEENGIKLYKCFVCGEWLSADNFDQAGGNKYQYRDGLDKRCHKCKVEQNKAARNNYSDEQKLHYLFVHRINGCKSRAKDKNISCDITIDDLQELWDRQKGICAISKIPMTINIDSGRNPYNISVDQINPSGGYTKDNIQLVCMCVNQLKSDFDMKTILNICKNILNNYEAEQNSGGQVS